MQKGGKRVGFGFRNCEPMITYATHLMVKRCRHKNWTLRWLSERQGFAGVCWSLTFSSCRLHSARFLHWECRSKGNLAMYPARQNSQRNRTQRMILKMLPAYSWLSFSFWSFMHLDSIVSLNSRFSTKAQHWKRMRSLKTNWSTWPICSGSETHPDHRLGLQLPPTP